MDEQGLNDAAILMMSLGEDDAAQIMRYLSPKEVQKIGEAIAATRTVTREQLNTVVERFSQATANQSLFTSDTGDYVRGVLTRALDDDKAQLMIGRILHEDKLGGIEQLKWMDPKSVGEMLRGEHPQIAAALLVQFDADHAADVLRQLPAALRHQVILRIARLDAIQPAALQELNTVLERWSAGGLQASRPAVGGIKTAADAINLLGGGLDAAVLDALRQQDPELAQQIVDLMFVFDDIVKLSDKELQLLLREVASETLIVALKGASPPSVSYTHLTLPTKRIV